MAVTSTLTPDLAKGTWGAQQVCTQGAATSCLSPDVEVLLGQDRKRRWDDAHDPAQTMSKCGVMGQVF